MIKVPSDLIAQVDREYQTGFNHVNNWRENTRERMESSLNDEPPEGKIKIDLVKENIEFELATFMTDSMDVRFVCDEGVIGQQTMKNAQKVAKYDYEDMDLELVKEQIIFDNGYKGIAVTTFDMWDNDEIQPIVGVIDPLTVIPDPKCHSGVQMRFVGFERRLNKYDIEGNDAFNTKGVSLDNLSDSIALKDAERAKRSDYFTDDSNEGLVPVYDHMTVWKGKKVLLTFVNGRADCIRMIELAPLSQAEKLSPTKVKFPVQFHRRKPKIGRWAGYSVLEEVQNSEDIVTQLKNLEIVVARQAAYGPDTLISDGLGIDIGELQKSSPGGRMIPVTQTMGGSLGNNIYQVQSANPNQYSIQTAQSVIDRSKRATGYTDISMGVSPTGQQTKSEIQTLQQNANKILSMVSSNYMRGMKEFWESWYRSYSLNMSPKAKKTIASFDNGGVAQSLKKKDFITDGKVLISIVSEQQETVKDEKTVAKFLALSNLVIPNLPKSAVNRFLRTLIDKSSVKGIDGETLIPLSIDERRAIMNADLLNRNIPLESKPMPGEDLDVYIQIYQELPQTNARDSALEMYIEAKRIKSIQETQQPPQTDNQGSAMALNMMANQQSTATPTM